MLATILACMNATSLAAPYWRGVDASFIPQYKDLGAVFYEGAKPIEPLAAFAKTGSNLLRLRVWVNPRDGYCSPERTLEMAREAKKLGMQLLIDFHYADSWADPGKQPKPQAWTDLSNEGLIEAVKIHTRQVIGDLVKQKTPPAIVQIGNEIADGLLWPTGRISRGGREMFGKLLKAGVEATRAAMPKDHRYGIMIHHDQGGKNAVCRWYFDLVKELGVDFDMIGLSFYPWWHGTLDDLQKNLNDLAARYGKPVMVVETAYPFTLQSGDATGNFVGRESQLVPGFPASPAGQSAFLKKLHEIVKAVPEHRGVGVCYWAPEYVAFRTIETPCENLCLFDLERKLLPGARALGEKPLDEE